MTNRHSKFNQGDIIMIRKDLISGHRYSVENSSEYETFSESMSMNLGREAMIMSVDEFGRYKLDIDDFFYYTDGMLENVVEANIAEPSDEAEIESLLEEVSKLIPEQHINYAIDSGNEKLFIELTNLYTDYLLTKDS